MTDAWANRASSGGLLSSSLGAPDAGPTLAEQREGLKRRFDVLGQAVPELDPNARAMLAGNTLVSDDDLLAQGLTVVKPDQWQVAISQMRQKEAGEQRRLWEQMDAARQERYKSFGYKPPSDNRSAFQMPLTHWRIPTGQSLPVLGTVSKDVAEGLRGGRQAFGTGLSGAMTVLGRPIDVLTEGVAQIDRAVEQNDMSTPDGLLDTDTSGIPTLTTVRRRHQLSALDAAYKDTWQRDVNEGYAGTFDQWRADPTATDRRKMAADATARSIGEYRDGGVFAALGDVLIHGSERDKRYDPFARTRARLAVDGDEEAFRVASEMAAGKTPDALVAQARTPADQDRLKRWFDQWLQGDRKGDMSRAVATLRGGTFSPGRAVAQGMGQDPSADAWSAYNVISGGTDAIWQLSADPLNYAGVFVSGAGKAVFATETADRISEQAVLARALRGKQGVDAVRDVRGAVAAYDHTAEARRILDSLQAVPEAERGADHGRLLAMAQQTVDDLAASLPGTVPDDQTAARRGILGLRARQAKRQDEFAHDVATAFTNRRTQAYEALAPAAEITPPEGYVATFSDLARKYPFSQRLFEDLSKWDSFLEGKGLGGIKSADDVWDWYQGRVGMEALLSGRGGRQWRRFTTLPSQTLFNQLRTSGAGAVAGADEGLTNLRASLAEGSFLKRRLGNLLAVPDYVTQLADSARLKAPSKGYVMLTGAGAPEDFRRFVDLGIWGSMPQNTRDYLYDLFVGGLGRTSEGAAVDLSATVALRHQVVQNTTRDLLQRLGVPADSELFERATRSVDQAYKVGTELDPLAGDVRSPSAVYPRTQAAHAVAIPDFTELIRGAEKAGGLTSLYGDTVGSRWMDRMMAKWRTGVVLRPAFVPRQAGQELIQEAMANGTHGLVLHALARSALKRTDEDRQVLAGFGWLDGLMSGAAQKAAAGSADGWAPRIAGRAHQIATDVTDVVRRLNQSAVAALDPELIKTVRMALWHDPSYDRGFTSLTARHSLDHFRQPLPEHFDDPAIMRRSEDGTVVVNRLVDDGFSQTSVHANDPLFHWAAHDVFNEALHDPTGEAVARGLAGTVTERLERRAGGALGGDGAEALRRLDADWQALSEGDQRLLFDAHLGTNTTAKERELLAARSEALQNGDRAAYQAAMKEIARTTGEEGGARTMARRWLAGSEDPVVQRVDKALTRLMDDGYSDVAAAVASPGALQFPWADAQAAAAQDLPDPRAMLPRSGESRSDFEARWMQRTAEAKVHGVLRTQPSLVTDWKLANTLPGQFVEKPARQGQRALYTLMVDEAQVDAMRDLLANADFAHLPPEEDLGGLRHHLEALAASVEDVPAGMRQTGLGPLTTWATDNQAAARDVGRYLADLLPGEGTLAIGRVDVPDALLTSEPWAGLKRGERGFTTRPGRADPTIPLTGEALPYVELSREGRGRAFRTTAPLSAQPVGDQWLRVIGEDGALETVFEPGERIVASASDAVAQAVMENAKETLSRLAPNGRLLHEVLAPFSHYGWLPGEAVQRIGAAELPQVLKTKVLLADPGEGMTRRFFNRLWDGSSRGVDALSRRPIYTQRFHEARLKIDSVLRPMWADPEIEGAAHAALAKAGVDPDVLLNAWRSSTQDTATILDDLLGIGAHGDDYHEAATALTVGLAKDAEQTGFEVADHLRNMAAIDPEALPDVARWLRHTDTVDRHILDLAAERARYESLPFVDDATARSQFSLMVRNVVPFWHAEEQFLARWAKTAVLNPWRFHRAALYLNGARQVGAIDDQGFLLLPGTPALQHVIESGAGILLGHPGLHDPTGEGARFRFGSIMPTPFTDQLPSGPLVQVAANGAARLFPELQPLAGEAAGFGANKNLLESLLPGPVAKVTQAVLSQGDGNARLQSMTIASMQHLAAESLRLRAEAQDEKDPEKRASLLARAAELAPDVNDPATQPEDLEAWKKHVVDLARVHLAYQGILSFLSPMSADTSPDRAGLAKEVQQALASSASPQEAFARFLADHPEATPYTVFASEVPSKAPLTALSDQAIDWMEANGAALQANRFGAPWLVPQGGDPSPAGRRAYAIELAMGLRRRKAPSEWVKDFFYASGATPYFAEQDAHEARLEAIKGTNPRASAARSRENAMWSGWADAFRTQHPVFDTVLREDRQTTRERALDEVRSLIDTPPEGMDLPDHAPAMRRMVRLYDDYKADRRVASLDKSRRGVRLVQGMDLAFRHDSAQLVRENPMLRPFWDSIIRPLAGVRNTEGEEMA